VKAGDVTSKTIMITGVSSGLGRAFAVEALAQGHVVVGTVRRGADAEAFEALRPGHAHARVLDLTDEPAIAPTVRQIEDSVGPIDVLIANAGYGFEGLFEESTLADLRAQFEVNVFGTVAVIQAVLPFLRSRKAGRILGVTSVGGLTTSPGLSFYHGSKFAMEGILEALGKEVAPIGIQVTAIEPGPFRTDWSGRSMAHAVRRISDYDASYEPIRAARSTANGRQPGDPAKAAKAVVSVIDAPTAPQHLLLGTAALHAVAGARAAFDDDRARFESLTRSTDFLSPEGASL
jgi:NAD(P)-dependent dehydrogenase (short-subunit alcohol dehydrogenase family)